MKNIYLGIFILTAIFCTPTAIYAKSKISITVSMPVSLKVIIDGYKFYSEDNFITINNITPGVHKIKVYYVKNNYDESNNNNLFRNGNNINWRSLTINAMPVRNNYYYDIIIPRSGKVFTDKTQLNGFEDEDENGSMEYGEGYDENYDDQNFFRKDFDKTMNSSIDKMNEDTWSNNNISRGNDNTDANNGYHNNAMSAGKFNELKGMVKNEIVEDNKMLLIKSATNSARITSQQAKELGSMFFSEFTKVDYAKYIYSKVLDSKNFFIIYDIFQSTFSKEEVSNYVNSKKE